MSFDASSDGSNWCLSNGNSDLIWSAMERGVGALESLQAANGSFGFHQLTQKGGSYESCGSCTDPLFATLTVLLAAGAYLPKPAVDRALRFIIDRRGADGHWNYDPAMGIPADSDDTACALAVLARFSPAQIKPADTSLLRSYWRSPDGPFRTWKSQDSPWDHLDRDDVVVNCNIVYALQCMGSPISSNKLYCLESMLRQSSKRSRYYCSPLTIGYAAVRAGFDSSLIPPACLSELSFSINSLELAQLLLIGGRKDKLTTSKLIAQQCSNGTWGAAPWCDGEGLAPWGSPAITTAICLEALRSQAQRLTPFR